METEIINAALKNLFNETGVEAKWIAGNQLDGKVIFTINGNEHQYVIEVKRELRQYQIPQIKEFREKYKDFMVVADNIFPKIRQQLRDIGIPYLETNGNVFLKRKDIHLLIDTKKQDKVGKTDTNRAFTKTGLKVLFQFLMHPELINATYREIAERANVGLGNIPLVIDGLKQTGYILALDKKTYVWEGREELIHRWIDNYAIELRPKTFLAKYDITTEWRDIRLNPTKTVWGGEPAADILTNYLRPGKFILHTTENKKDLITKYRLVPNENGNVEVLEKFWDKNGHKETAPPMLVYAELILEGGKRNKEVAQNIYERFIQTDL